MNDIGWIELLAFELNDEGHLRTRINKVLEGPDAAAKRDTVALHLERVAAALRADDDATRALFAAPTLGSA